MMVFNLTNRILDFHGRHIDPNGGSVEIEELDSFIPDRDRKLEAAKMVSFGSLPSWFRAKMEKDRGARMKRVPKVKAVTQASAPKAPVVAPAPAKIVSPVLTVPAEPAKEAPKADQATDSKKEDRKRR